MVSTKSSLKKVDIRMENPAYGRLKSFIGCAFFLKLEVVSREVGHMLKPGPCVQVLRKQDEQEENGGNQFCRA